MTFKLFNIKWIFSFMHHMTSLYHYNMVESIADFRVEISKFNHSCCVLFKVYPSEKFYNITKMLHTLFFPIQALEIYYQLGSLFSHQIEALFSSIPLYFSLLLLEDGYFMSVTLHLTIQK